MTRPQTKRSGKAVVSAEHRVRALAAGRETALHQAAFRRAGRRAAPALLDLAGRLPRNLLPTLLECMELCWTPATAACAVNLLADRTAAVREAAARAIDRRCGRAALARECEPLCTHANAAVAAFAMVLVETAQPDLERMARCVAAQAPRRVLLRFLPRYYAEELRCATRALLELPDPDLRRVAIIALAEQCDDSVEARRGIVAQLGDNRAQVREAAAEYLVRFGTRSENQPLAAAAAKERNIHVRAALSAALASRPAASIATPRATAHRGVAGRYAKVVRLLAASGRGARRRALDAFSSAEAFEPLWMADSQAAAGTAFKRARAERYAAGRALFPPPDQARDVHTAPDPARRLVAPLSDFPRRPTGSYGVYLDARTRLFNALVHVGEDAGWYRDHGTVVSIAPGQVLSVEHEPSWGHIVVIEHRADPALTRRVYRRFGTAIDTFARAQRDPPIDAEGCLRFCTLYAHLAASPAVSTGMVVTDAQRIGAIGRSYTWENGGYAAHLHCGVHLGPYVQVPRRGATIDCNYQGRPYRARVGAADEKTTDITIVKQGRRLNLHLTTAWVRGYISRWAWRAEDHGWLDPVRFVASGAAGR